MVPELYHYLDANYQTWLENRNASRFRNDFMFDLSALPANIHKNLLGYHKQWIDSPVRNVPFARTIFALRRYCPDKVLPEVDSEQFDSFGAYAHFMQVAEYPRYHSEESFNNKRFKSNVGSSSRKN